MTFYILTCRKTATVLSGSDGQPIRFDTRQEAETVAAARNDGTFYYMPVGPLLEDALDWRKREADRLASGEHKRLLPELEQYCPPQHFAHVSKGDPKAIAYTKDPVDGVVGVIKRMRIAAYLEKYAPNLSANMRNVLEARQVQHSSAASVEWALTADEIEHVYTNYNNDYYGVANSCMRYQADRFPSKQHPCRAYGDSDFRVAYFKDDYGDTTTRAVVCEEKKIFTRVYGSDYSISALMQALYGAGYKKSAGYYGSGGSDTSSESFVGSKLRALALPSKKSVVCLPYLDEACYGLVVDGDQFVEVMSNRPARRWVSLQQTDGLSYIQESCCDHCGRSGAVEAGRVDEPVHNIYRQGGNYTQRDYAYICPTCRDRSRGFFRCAGTGLLFSSNHVTSVTVGSQVYVRAWAEANLKMCGHCGRFHTPDATFLPVTQVRGGMRVEAHLCPSCVSGENLFWCVVTERAYTREFLLEYVQAPRKRVAPGRVISRGVSVDAMDENGYVKSLDKSFPQVALALRLGGELSHLPSGFLYVARAANGRLARASGGDAIRSRSLWAVVAAMQTQARNGAGFLLSILVLRETDVRLGRSNPSRALANLSPWLSFEDPVPVTIIGGSQKYGVAVYSSEVGTVFVDELAVQPVPQGYAWSWDARDRLTACMGQTRDAIANVNAVAVGDIVSMKDGHRPGEALICVETKGGEQLRGQVVDPRGEGVRRTVYTASVSLRISEDQARLRELTADEIAAIKSSDLTNMQALLADPAFANITAVTTQATAPTVTIADGHTIVTVPEVVVSGGGTSLHPASAYAVGIDDADDDEDGDDLNFDEDDDNN